MIYVFHPEALDDYAEHIAFYKSLRKILAQKFHQAVNATITSICESPLRHRISYQPDIRELKISGFPHYVIFRVTDDSVQILAIAHPRRRPLYWLDRT